MELIDSRRLTGANAISDGPGAVIDVAVGDSHIAALVEGWEKTAQQVLAAVGWERERTFVRQVAGGVSLAISAPIDALYAATEVNEWAFAAAASQPHDDLQTAAQYLRAEIEKESNPSLLRLAAAAQEHGLVFLSDDDRASVGLGSGSQTWDVDRLPTPDEVDWQRLHDIPVGLISGTNGKTTSARLAAAVMRAADRHVGYSSTDWLAIDEEVIDQGDYAGPEGARTVLRNTRIDCAILETARGGLLRRGVGVPRAQAALLTRIARDHIGDFGSRNLDELLDAKWVITRPVGVDGRIVINADDALLVARAAESTVPVVYYSLDSENPVITRHIVDGGEAWVLHEGDLCHYHDNRLTHVVDAASIPVTLGGAARYNISNALGVAGLTHALGVDHDAIVSGLQHFRPESNPGRGNLFEIDGVKVLVDFAHNPDAFRAIVDLARNLRARRKLIAFGEAGDRTDALICDLATTAWQLEPDRVITLEIGKYARGRAPGEIRDLLHSQFEQEGAHPGQLDHHQTEIGALEDALTWAEPGDLVILLSLAEQDEILARCQQAANAG